MRSSIITAAFAAGVLALPNKRDLATAVEIDIVTAFVTVTAGQPLATSAAIFSANNRVLASAPAAVTSAAAVVVDQAQAAGSDDSAQASDDSSAEALSNSSSDSQQGSSDSAPSGDSSNTSGQSGSSNQPNLVSGPTGSYQQTVIDHHNAHRANHSAPDIRWSDSLASTAQKIGETCVYAHNTDMDGGGYGQNIAAGVSPDGISRVITDMFYNNEVNYFNGLYHIADPSDDNFEAWGHFSQIVWKETTDVGCATVDCSSTGVGWFTVCNYKGPGNFSPYYADNIGEPLGFNTIHG